MKRLILSIISLIFLLGNACAQEYRDLVADMTESHLASVSHDSWKASVADGILKIRKDCTREQAEQLAEQFLGERYNQVVIDLLAPTLEKVMSFEELESWNEVWLQTEIIRVNQMINECLRAPELVKAEAEDLSKMESGKKIQLERLACSLPLLKATSEYLDASGYFGWDDAKLKPSDSAQRYRRAVVVRVANAFNKGGVTEELLDEMKTVTVYPEYKKMCEATSSCLNETTAIAEALKKDLQQWLRDR